MMLESLTRRVDAVEAKLNMEEGDKSVLSAVQELNSYLSSYINQNQSLGKLIRNINTSKINIRLFSQSPASEDAKLQKQFILTNIARIDTLAHNLIIIQNIEKSIELDPSLLLKHQTIAENFDRLKQCESTYNELLIRSIAVLQNYININDNINKFWKTVDSNLHSQK